MSVKKEPPGRTQIRSKRNEFSNSFHKAPGFNTSFHKTLNTRQNSGGPTTSMRMPQRSVSPPPRKLSSEDTPTSGMPSRGEGVSSPSSVSPAPFVHRKFSIESAASYNDEEGVDSGLGPEALNVLTSDSMPAKKVTGAEADDHRDPADQAPTNRKVFCVVGDANGEVKILNIAGLEHELVSAKRQIGQHMHFHHHDISHSHEQQLEWDPDEVIRSAKQIDLELYLQSSLGRHIAIQESLGESGGGLLQSRAGASGTHKKSKEHIAKRSAQEHALLQVAKDDPEAVCALLGKLGKDKDGSTEADWRDRLTLLGNGGLSYVSEKMSGELNRICELKSIAGVEMMHFAPAKYQFGFTIRFFDGTHITFAAASEDDRIRVTEGIARSLSMADQENLDGLDVVEPLDRSSHANALPSPLQRRHGSQR